MAIRLSASRVFRWHLIAIVLLGILNLAVLIGDSRGYHGLMGFSLLFRLSGEGNAPSMFSALALVAAALTAARNAQSDALRDGERAGWRTFAIVLAVMAIDESIQIHEMVSGIGTHLYAASPWLLFTVYPYALVALGVAVLLFRFWERQNRAVMTGIALGGICYVAAAVGMETVEKGLLAAGEGYYDISVAASVSVEELGEMIAVALLLRAFLVRFGELGGGTLLSLAGERPMVEIEFAPGSELDQALEPVAVQSEPQR